MSPASPRLHSVKGRMLSGLIDLLQGFVLWPAFVGRFCETPIAKRFLIPNHRWRLRQTPYNYELLWLGHHALQYCYLGSAASFIFSPSVSCRVTTRWQMRLRGVPSAK